MDFYHSLKRSRPFLIMIVTENRMNINASILTRRRQLFLDNLAVGFASIYFDPCRVPLLAELDLYFNAIFILHIILASTLFYVSSYQPLLQHSVSRSPLSPSEYGHRSR